MFLGAFVVDVVVVVVAVTHVGLGEVVVIAVVLKEVEYVTVVDDMDVLLVETLIGFAVVKGIGVTRVKRGTCCKTGAISVTSFWRFRMRRKMSLATILTCNESHNVIFRIAKSLSESQESYLRRRYKLCLVLSEFALDKI